jgi:hypothetical protein
MEAVFADHKHIRLFAFCVPEGWQSALYNLATHEWIDRGRASLAGHLLPVHNSLEVYGFTGKSPLPLVHNAVFLLFQIGSLAGHI